MSLAALPLGVELPLAEICFRRCHGPPTRVWDTGAADLFALTAIVNHWLQL
jgi:hypothetical protein